MGDVGKSSDCADFRQLAEERPIVHLSREAQRRLYEKHGPYLLSVLKGRAARLLSLSSLTAEDLLHETFFRAFARSSAYRCGPDEGSEEESRRTRAWLGRIAQRLLADHLRKNQESPLGLEMDEIVDEGPPSSGTQQARLVREALSQLSEREQDILRVTALYHRVGETHQRLPNEVADELSRTWGISSDNLRAIRKRSLLKVKEYVQNALTDNSRLKGTV